MRSCMVILRHETCGQTSAPFAVSSSFSFEPICQKPGIASSAV